MRVADQLPSGSAAERFNAWLAVKITSGVGTMWCVAQTFIQLVVLSTIIVGQNIQSAAADKRTEETYKDVEALMHQGQQLEAHLRALAAITCVMRHLGIDAAPG